MADVFAKEHFRLGEIHACRVDPTVAFLKREAHHHVEHHPYEWLRVGIALVAQRDKAVVFILQERALGGYAVQTAGMLADDVAGLGALVEAVAVEGFLLLREARADEQLDGFRRDSLYAVDHAAVGKALIIPRHVMRRGFHAGAAAERGQDGPFIIAGHAAFAVLFKQARDVAARHGSGFAAIEVEHGARHAHGLEHALHQELFERDAGGDVHHIGKDGIALVAVAHVFAGLTERGVRAVGDVVDHLVNGLHLVGGGALHLTRPFAVTPGRVERDGPFERLHGRDACRVHGKVAQRHVLLRVARHAEVREVLAHGIIEGELAFCCKDAAGERRHGFAHGGDAIDSVFIHGAAGLKIRNAIAFFKYHAVRAVHGNGNAGKLFFLDVALKRCVQLLKIECHVMFSSCAEKAALGKRR